jgi:hypothetical protein
VVDKKEGKIELLNLVIEIRNLKDASYEAERKSSNIRKNKDKKVLWIIHL